jgi:VanZ family protein
MRTLQQWLPTGQIATAAYDNAAEHEQPFLRSHSVRSFLFATTGAFVGTVLVGRGNWILVA